MDGRGLRARKKLATRERIVEAAFELFAAQGFDAVNVEDIAARAGVSRRSVFRYFATKDELFFVDAPRRLELFERLLTPESPSEAPLVAVRRACLALAAEYMQMRESLVLRQSIVEASPVLARRERELDRRFESAIETAISARYRRPPRALRRQISIFAGAIFGAIRATLDDWFAGEGKSDLVELASSGIEFLETGLALPAPPARASSRSKP